MELLHAAYTAPGEKGRRGFEDLECYRLALDVMLNAHQVAAALPNHERYDLAAQLRRASKSVPANIAEGYGRFHYLDSLKFYSNARGSLNETLSHFITCRVLGYLEQAYFEQVYTLTRQAEKSLNGFMAYVRRQKAGSEPSDTHAVRDIPADYWINVTPYPPDPVDE